MSSSSKKKTGKRKNHSAEAGIGELDKLRLLSEYSRDIVCLHNADHTYQFVSSSCRAILGYDPVKMIGTNPWSLVHPDDIEQLQKEGIGNINSDKPFLLTYRIRNKSGDFIWFESVSRVIKNSKGEVTGFVTSSRDISERKKAEESVLESEKKFRMIYEKSPIGICVSDNNYRFIRANSAFCEFLGYTESELQNLYIRDVSHPDSRKATLELLRKAENSGDTVCSLEKKYIRKDGQTVWGRTFLSWIYGEDGNTVLRLAMVQDINEQVKARESLRENEERLSEQNIKLERKTIALGEVLEQVETEKNRLKEKINSNLQAVLLPLVARLKTVRPEQATKYLGMLEESLNDILTSFGPALTDPEYGFTSREREICSLVKNGLTSKEIARLMDISCRTVDRHRENIREKLGISGSKKSLAEVLNTLSC